MCLRPHTRSDVESGMTFDPRSLLTEPLPPDLTIDGLAAVLKHLSRMGMGGAGVRLPGGMPIKQVQLVAQGEVAAYFQLIDARGGG